MTPAQELENVLKEFASKLVDTPQALVIVCHEKDDKIFFILSSKNKGEIGQLIGERGNIANSLRVLLRAVSRKMRTKEVSLAVTPEITAQF
jgi:predicted RNA-binding protein YlqC (UPF0109 family)